MLPKSQALYFLQYWGAEDSNDDLLRFPFLTVKFLWNVKINPMFKFVLRKVVWIYILCFLFKTKGREVNFNFICSAIICLMYSEGLKVRFPMLNVKNIIEFVLHFVKLLVKLIPLDWVSPRYVFEHTLLTYSHQLNKLRDRQKVRNLQNYISQTIERNEYLVSTYCTCFMALF